MLSRGMIAAILILCLGGAALAYAVWPGRQTGKGVTVAIEGASPSPVASNAALPAPGFEAQAGAAVGGQKLALCSGQPEAAIEADGRVLGHFSYADTASADMVAPPSSFQSPGCKLIHRDVASALSALVAAAGKDDAAVGKAIMGVSCFRGAARQKELFCNGKHIKKGGLVAQAKWVAPPGYSEHATGYAIDFGARTIPSCHTNPCFKTTRTGKWLAANARKFGFELSFPEGNKQGVSFEPWHFRWVGNEAAKARFSKARAAFP